MTYKIIEFRVIMYRVRRYIFNLFFSTKLMVFAYHIKCNLLLKCVVFENDLDTTQLITRDD